MTNTTTHAVFACYDSGCRQRVAACGADRGTQNTNHPNVGTNRIPALAYHVCQSLQPSVLTTHTAMPHNTNTITLFTQRHLLVYQTNVLTVLDKHLNQKPAVVLTLNLARGNDVTPANVLNINTFAPISGYIRTNCGPHVKVCHVTHDFNTACSLTLSTQQQNVQHILPSQ
jgi:hypothetical protein